MTQEPQDTAKNTPSDELSPEEKAALALQHARKTAEIGQPVPSESSQYSRAGADITQKYEDMGRSAAKSTQSGNPQDAVSDYPHSDKEDIQDEIQDLKEAYKKGYSEESESIQSD